MTDMSMEQDGWGPARVRNLNPSARLGVGAVRPYFDSTSPGLGKLAYLGGFLTVITLGIYRFWYTTHLRRQLWRRSVLGGTNFEYTGTVKEIFVGFLIVLAILVPIYLLSIIGQFSPGVIGTLANLAFLAALALFFAIATYRARRYRLTRTLWRGVRFGQTGSGLGYAMRLMLWLIVGLLTLGLAAPFARAALERYRVNHTWYGDRAFKSRASGFAMLLPWVLYLAVGLLPLAYAAMVFYDTVPASFVAILLESAAADGELPPGVQVPPGFDSAILTLSVAIGWTVFALTVFWPAYRAAELRSFIGRASLGETRFASDFSALSIYGAYLGFALVAVVTIAAVGGVSWFLFERAGGMDAMSGPSLAGVIVSYVALLWLLGALKLTWITVPLWGKLLTSVTVDGIEHLDDIAARRDRADAVGDDYAGGYDIGAV